MAVVRKNYRDNLRIAVGSSAAPYGYTLATWTTGAVIVHAHGLPDTLDALLFMVGAVLGFAFVGALAFGGLRARYTTRKREAARWRSFDFPSVGLAIGATWLVSYAVPNDLAWPLGAFSSTAAYLLVMGLEVTLTEVQDE